MNNRKVLLAMITSPFAHKAEHKPIKTVADLMEAIDRGLAEGFSSRPMGTSSTIELPEIIQVLPAIELKLTITGYTNPENDVVRLRFGGDGK